MSMERTKTFLIRVCMLTAVTLFALDMSAQSIHGNVKDNVGEPAIGATVQVVGQTTGAVTDLDGNFSIDAKAGETLRISYVGFDKIGRASCRERV